MENILGTGLVPNQGGVVAKNSLCVEKKDLQARPEFIKKSPHGNRGISFALDHLDYFGPGPFRPPISGTLVYSDLLEYTLSLM